MRSPSSNLNYSSTKIMAEFYLSNRDGERRHLVTVDDDVLEWIEREGYRYHCLDSRGKPYAVRRRRKADGPGPCKIYLHREIWFLDGLEIPYGYELDHADGNSLNNNRENLRLATHRQNLVGRKAENKTGYRGVYVNGEKWSSAIMDGKRNRHIHIGTFDNPLAAARAYDAVARELHGEFARLNFGG